MNSTRKLLPAATQPQQGIVFDQHYTDSLFRVALGPKQYRPLAPLARSVKHKDVLLSLLLFDTAHITKPFWLTDEAVGGLEPLQAEGIITVIPDATYASAFTQVRAIVEKALQLLSFRDDVQMVSFDTQTGKIGRDSRGDLQRYSDATEIVADVKLLLKSFQYIDPVCRAAAHHLGDATQGITNAIDLVNHLDGGLGLLSLDETPEFGIDIADSLDEFLRASLDILSAKNTNELVNCVFRRDKDDHEDSEPDVDVSSQHAIAQDARRLRVALLAALTSTACERHAATSRLPMRTTATTDGARIDRTAGEDAYQLFKIQFTDLRYPVLENLDDVRRLRASPHLRSYRAVIQEYGQRMRTDVEAGKSNVLKNFHDDLRLAHSDLKKLGKGMAVFSSVSFWASFPLMAVALFLGLPLDNALLLPATAFARHYEKKRLKELDWLLLGRS